MSNLLPSAPALGGEFLFYQTEDGDTPARSCSNFCSRRLAEMGTAVPSSCAKRETVCSLAKAEYLGVAADGPYKPEHYRY